ncbi:MAG TPA: peptidylprolyl isomerase [Ideonella sp.]|uniref:peptidylprolyl isomerase n=1 Tax=Ideonella sp. TaxID=1929293 RepID=UPI002BEDA536|nr:peptidylprolyl isomerase [Ideonella sp.]HSI52168.1 peptidylprolyl isomerase [Ideonella sp.]
MPSSTPAKPPRAGLPNWTREPLLHFLLLGALLFGADHLLVSRSDDPHTIVVGAAVDKEAIEIFKASRNREPNAEELTALRKVWLDNEVLYREGLALQVDRGDSAIRDRVIFKALSVVDANTKLPPADDETLKKFFESHRVKYDEPARFDFQEAALDGDSAEAAVRAFVAQLNAGTPGDAKAGLRVFKGRPHQNLVLSYGEEFAKALETAPMGEWRAEKTRDGWRAVRLEAVSPAKPAQFEVLRPVVQQDWTDATLSEQRSAAVQLLAKKYNIRYEDAK